MPYSLEDKLVVAITSRALFDLEDAHRIFLEQGLEAYRRFQLQREAMPLSPGTGFPLVKALLSINDRLPAGERLVEVVLLSRNDADSGLRIWNSIEACGLDITRGVFTDGRSPYVYLPAFRCDLFLSANESDVQAALGRGQAAALVYAPATRQEDDYAEVRIAFDGDAVLFSDSSERIFQEQGLEAFQRYEQVMEDVPLEPGPFKGFVDALKKIQEKFPEDKCPIRTALVTSRNAPAQKRPIKTLRHWGVRLDETFFLGGMEKSRVLDTFRPHIFLDDQSAHLDTAALSTPSARVFPVPVKTETLLPEGI